MKELFRHRLFSENDKYAKLVNTPNSIKSNDGIKNRYKYPILTGKHIPVHWRYDLDDEKNPFFQERLGINAVFNAGSMYINKKHLLVARVEGYDRKSFFAVAESQSGVDGFRFWDFPILMPETTTPDTNIYDMRLTAHQDGWIYGLFCTERRDPSAPDSDQMAAIAQCGIARTHDLINWERLPDLKTNSGQQRNVVLHPEFIHGKYALYTRPQDGFIDAGEGGGIGWGLTDSMYAPTIEHEIIIDPKKYHTIKEIKNGQGPPPIKTKKGWLHLAHGVRNTAAGLRYVLYMFLTSLEEPWIVIKKPGGYFMAPEDDERIGDVSNVLFCNGWNVNENGDVFIYYASSDTRLHVATSTIAQLLDYIENTPEDGFTSFHSTSTRIKLIETNLERIKKSLQNP